MTNDKTLKTSTPTTNYRFLLAATLLLGAIFVFLIMPLYNNIVFEKQDLVQKKAFLSLLKSNLENKLKMVSTNAMVDEVDKDIQMLQGFFIAKSGVEQIVEQLENIADSLKLGVKIKIEEDPGDIIILNLGLAGGYNNINNFLRSIELMPYALIIDSIKLERNSPLSKIMPRELFEEPSAENKIKGNTKIKIYTKEFLNENSSNKPNAS